MEIGYYVDGGLLFYKNEQEGYGLVVSIADLGDFKWQKGFGNDFTLSNATSETDGAGNTKKIVNNQGIDSSYAALAADRYTFSGFDGWYLPSKQEVILISENRLALGFNSGEFVWSSTEVDETKAVVVNITYGTIYEFTKDFSYPVKAIRRIKLDTSGGSKSGLPESPIRLLFDRNNTGNHELKELTGSYYANNNFTKIKNEIAVTTKRIIDIVGMPVYSLAESFYYGDTDETDFLIELLNRFQLAIAYPAALEFFKSNIVSHEDSGRKIKLNKANESMPWEWMLDRDDEIHQQKANAAIDRLIAFLDNADIPEWNGSTEKLATRTLFVNTTQMFDRIFPIDGSGYFYHLIKPFIAEVQRTQILPALGKTRYTELLAMHQNDLDSADEDDELLLVLIQQCIPLLTMLIAVDRLSLSVMPYGLVQKFKSERQTRNANLIAPDDAIKKYLVKLERSATRAFDVMKKQLNASFNYDDYPLLPENNEDQKFFRT